MLPAGRGVFLSFIHTVDWCAGWMPGPEYQVTTILMAQKRSQKKDAIALVGMSCVYPGALSPEELWTNIMAGRRFFRTLPDERLPRSDYYDPDPRAPGKTYADKIAVIDGWKFDPLDYRIPPITAYGTDIVHWLSLDTARRALLDAKIDLDRIDKALTGVVLGNSLGGEFARSHYLRFRWPYVARSIRRALEGSGADEAYIESVLKSVRVVYESPLPEINEDSLAGNMSNTISGRICNYFDFGAGCYTIDGACSSSLLAIAKACDALLSGDMKIALAGGVDVSLDAFEVVGFSKTQALSKDDIRPYDKHAAGMLTGEGCGMFVLMKEEDAQEAGLPIRALIRGWGISSDGAGAITAPEVEGQLRALRSAYRRAGYTIGTVGLIEGHGTGTPVGDKVELTALRTLIEETPGETPCAIGSIKANIGHCKAAAGSAGMLKSIMALERKILPPTLNCETPNPVFDGADTLMRPSVNGGMWEKGSHPRRASVSAMGFGGINTHVTLEEANPEDAPQVEDLELLRSYRRTELIVLSGKTTEELLERIAALLALSKRICRAELTDLAATLADEEPAGPLRIALVVDSPWKLRDVLEQVAQTVAETGDVSACHDPEGSIFAGSARENPRCVALFPGQGSQFVTMGTQFMRAYPGTDSFISEVDRAIEEELPGGVRPLLQHDAHADAADRERWSKELAQTENAQPAITAVSVSIFTILAELGIQPEAVIGHSLGEIAALHAAGVYDGLTAVRLAAARGKAMGGMKGDHGGMTAVKAAPEAIEPLIAEVDGYLIIANYNSPRQTVVAGADSALAAFETKCKANGLTSRRLNVSHAFHTELVAPAAKQFSEMVQAYKFSQQTRPVISSITGGQLSTEEDIQALLAGQITSPVRFTAAVRTAQELQPDMWIEIGPGGVLSNLVRAICGAETNCYGTHLPGEDAHSQINRIAAHAFVLGFPVVLNTLFANRYSKPISIENYAPEFITNPCERPVTEEIPAITGAGITAGSVVPDGVDSTYLQERGAYLRDMIEVDYRHWAKEDGRAPAAMTGGSAALSQSTAAAEHVSAESILDYAIEWIAQRTGFPRSAIQPEMKLRDDLNLDSIKVGELVYNVSRKLNKQVPADPSGYANAQLSKLITVIQNDFKDVEESQPVSDVTGVTGGPKVPSLGEWIRTFQVENVPAPLSAEAFSRLPTRGKLYVVGDPACRRVQTFTNHMTRHGLQPEVLDSATLDEQTPAPEDISMLVCILPSPGKRVMACNPAEFDARVEGGAEGLFRIFKWVGQKLDSSWTNLRCVIARPYGSADTMANETELPDVYDEDADAGRACMKTLQIEHTSFRPKWLALPEVWSPEQWATLMEKELQTTGRRVYYAYAPDGTRYTKAALPMGELSGTGLELGPEDVILCTGGAKGITFEIAYGLAKKTGAVLALTGRSPLPASDETGNEIANNFQKLDRDGIQYIYVQCDVNDREVLQQAVAQIETEKGRITGFLHGAGITNLHLFSEITRPQFLDTIRVKARGLYNLLACIPASQLKMVHTLSSVLGHTGMAGQTDYTMANAWLDATIRELHAVHPELHCLSLGYTIWSETGLGRKLGAVDSLHAAGTVPVDTREGVARYLALLDRSVPDPVCIITGRLNDELDPYLFPPHPPIRYRFLQRILRYIPQTECVVEVPLTHNTDWYLAEHVFQGTPLFPGVMALEAMTQVAQYCLGCSDLPVFENIQFNKAIIVPDDARVTVRIFVLAEPAEKGVTRVKTAICVDTDNFESQHLTADLVFGEELQVPAQALPGLNGDIGKHPDEFNPVPLFQGKFFRRISTIRKIEYENEVICDITIPERERYYSAELPRDTVMPSPAARDAFLHSGILALPPNSLPARIKRLCVYGVPAPQDTVICHGRVMERQDADEYRSNMTIFDENGTVLETIEGIVTRVPQGGPSTSETAGAAPVPAGRIEEDLKGLLADIPHAFSLVRHEEIVSAPEISDGDREQAEKVGLPRREAYLAGLLAARRAAVVFAAGHGGVTLEPQAIQLEHDPNGAPHITVNGDTSAQSFAGVTVSIADAAGYAVAIIAPETAGIDLEPVESRDAETWRALLNDDGYTQALHMAGVTRETFDRAATRIWALLESSKKAHNLRRVLPLYDTSRGSSWHSSSSVLNGARVENLSALMTDGAELPCAALAITIPSRQATATNNRAVHLEFDATLSEMTQRLRTLESVCVNDPKSPDTAAHHEQVVDCVNVAINRLIEIEGGVEPAVLYELRKRTIERFSEFVGGCDIVSHAIEQPYGYIGDFMMLEKLLENTTSATGLAYHLDTLQLSHAASEACRNRVKWVCETLTPIITARENPTVKLLDIGIGSAPVERALLDSIPGLKLSSTAIDIEPAALAFVEEKLAGRAHELNLLRVDLRRDDAGDQLAALAGEIDACVSIGILEALRDEEVIHIFGSLFKAMPRGSLLFVESFLPNHPTQPYMEWFMDYHLGYRTKERIIELMTQAGADPSRIATPIESTGSLGFVMITV